MSFEKSDKNEEMFAMNPINDSHEKDSTKEGKSYSGLVELLNAYAEKCSLNGVIFIKSSRFFLVKIIWTILLLGALVVMGLHLSQLAIKFYAREVQSQIDLKFESFPFPAVTICNVNPVRKSQLPNASKKLRGLVAKIRPENLMKEVDEWEPEYVKDTVNFDEDDNPIGRHRIGRNKRSTISDSLTVEHRKNNFFDDLNITDIDDDDDDDDYSERGSWEAESKKASFDVIQDKFTQLYLQENSTLRQRMGHQIKHMLVQCSYAGRKCQQKNFTLVMTSNYGNCYTLEYSKFITRKSGPRFGLSLILFLETDEYVPGISNSKGARVTVHDSGTVPFPDDEGVAVGAGTDTSIGLRRVSVSRIKAPWGDCSENQDFRDTYKIQYTRQACQQICTMEQIKSNCGCYDQSNPTTASFIKGKAKLKPCQINRKLTKCMRQAQWNFSSNNATCNCHNPCYEIDYRETVSSQPWPDAGFAKLIASTICKDHKRAQICKYNDDDAKEMKIRENFARVNIFFQTLNYEALKEEPDYTEFQFVSDIGGTVGLYVGLSVLSLFEIAHLLISIVNHLFNTNTRKKS